MKRYIGTYSNGYAGCDDVFFFLANNEKDVDNYMKENLCNYAASYEHIAYNDYDESDEDFYESTEYENYFADCSYDYREATEDDIFDYSVTDNDWITLEENT